MMDINRPKPHTNRVRTMDFKIIFYLSSRTVEAYLFPIINQILLHSSKQNRSQKSKPNV